MLYQSFDEYNVMSHIKEQTQSVIVKCISNYIKNSKEEIIGIVANKEKMQYELLETFAQNSNGAPMAAAVITGLETGHGVAGMMNDFFSKTEGDEKENVKKTEDISEFV